MSSFCLWQIYLDGEDTYQKDVANTSNRLQGDWRTTCREVHKGWDIQFWDLKKAEQFLSEKAAWFLPLFRALPKTVLKGNVLSSQSSCSKWFQKWLSISASSFHDAQQPVCSWRRDAPQGPVSLCRCDASSSCDSCSVSNASPCNDALGTLSIN